MLGDMNSFISRGEAHLFYCTGPISVFVGPNPICVLLSDLRLYKLYHSEKNPSKTPTSQQEAKKPRTQNHGVPCRSRADPVAAPPPPFNFPTSPHIKTPSSSSKTPNTLLLTLRTTISSAVLLTATSAALLSGKSRADPSIPPPSTVETIPLNEIPESQNDTSTLYQLLDSDELSDDIRKIVYTKIDTASYNEEKLSLLCKVISIHPSEVEWKISEAMLLSDKHEIAKARKILEEVLSQEPLSLVALSEYAILMDLAKDYSAMYKRLEEAMEIANGENKEKEVRGIRFIKAWMLIFQRKLKAALKSLEELRIEDPEDYRSYFALGVVYSLMDKSKDAKEVFQKLEELSGGNIEVETLLKNGRLGMAVFRSEEKVHKVEFRVFSYDRIDR